MRRALLLVVALAACGGADEPTRSNAASAWRANDCVVLADYRACYRSTASGESRTAIEYRVDGVWRQLPVAHPFHRAGQPKVGHWRWVAESPDGATLLAQWSAECEVPIAFFVPAAGGKPRAAARDRYGPATSRALGWARDGRAIVELPESACGSGVERPGVYLIAPDTDERELWKPVGAVEASLKPRDAG